MEKIRIQDDLFHHVNQEKIDELVIPDDMPQIGGFNTLHTEVEKLMIDEFNQMSESKDYPDVYLERACLLYSEIKNIKKREKYGIKPVLKNLSVINKLTSIRSFNNKLADLVINRMPLPFSIGVDVDMKDTNKHCVIIQGPSVILPDAYYYKPEMAQQKDAILGVWAHMAKMILAETKLSEEDQAKYIQDTLAFDSILGNLVKTSEEWSEYVNMYNPMKTSKVHSMLKPVNFKRLLNNLFGFEPEKIIVAEPRYFKAFKEVFNENTFELYKHWAYVKEIVSSTSLLSEKLRDAGFADMMRLATATAKELAVKAEIGEGVAEKVIEAAGQGRTDAAAHIGQRVAVFVIFKFLVGHCTRTTIGVIFHRICNWQIFRCQGIRNWDFCGGCSIV